MSLLARTLATVWLICIGLTASAWAWELPAADVIGLAELPPEARRTLELIRKGGPFPYRNDGMTFGNRERRLPPREHGYYREYTVPTPASKDRGARRIVAGRNADYYYSDDHYHTFRRIRE